MSILDLAVMAGLLFVMLWVAPSALHSSQQRALCATFFFWLLAKAFWIPSVAAATDSLYSGGQLSLLLRHVVDIAASIAILRFLAFVACQDDVSARQNRRRLWLGGGVSVTLCALFFLTSDPIRGSELFAAQAPPSVLTAAYWLLLESFLGYALITAALLFYRVSRQAKNRSLRYGSRIIAVGCALNSVWVPALVALQLVRLVGVQVSVGWLEQPLNTVVLAGTLMVVVGISAPALGATSTLIRRRRQVRQLMPLWQELTETFPHVVLQDGPGAHPWNWGSTRLRLYRQVIEVRDGMLSAWAYLSPEAWDEAFTWVAHTELVGDEAEATVEACCLARALQAQQRGLAPTANGVTPKRGGTVLDDEVRWLLMVSSAHRSQMALDFCV